MGFTMDSLGDRTHFSMESKLIEAALERVVKTWKTYITAICILLLTLIIDALSGFSFLRGGEPIDLAGFKVVREALSATYGILFSVFVVNARISNPACSKPAHPPPTFPQQTGFLCSIYGSSRHFRTRRFCAKRSGFCLLSDTFYLRN